MEQADKLVAWMSQYIGHMAPGAYGDCYRDLNEHFIFMSKMPTEDAEAPSAT